MFLCGMIWVTGVRGHILFSQCYGGGFFSSPHSIELAHDQFQNETFVCQTCTAVIGLLLVCYIMCHLLAPFLDKKSGERS